MPHEIHFVEIRHQFTPDELSAIGPILAQQLLDFQEKEEEKKTVMSDFKHQLDQIKQQIFENRNRLNNRFEMREVRARMIKNYKTFTREFYSTDTFDLVKTEPFKSHDYQRDFDDVEESPFGTATDPTPEPEGTADSNPAQYEQLIRELNYWRDQLLVVTGMETDDQIDAGLNITNKIKSIEAVLKAMDPEPTPEDSADQSDSPAASGDTDTPGDAPDETPTEPA